MRGTSALFVDIYFLYGRLGQIVSIRTPCKILTLGTEIKKPAGGTF